MDTIIEYAGHIMELSIVLMENPQGLNAEQMEYVEAIYKRSDEFVAAYMEKQAVTIQDLRRYLSHDARTPLTVIIGCCDLVISRTLGDLHETYSEVFEQIREYGHFLHNELTAMHEEVNQFMQKMGIER